MLRVYKGVMTFYHLCASKSDHMIKFCSHQDITLSDFDVIMNHTTTIYNSDDASQRESLLTTSEFVKLPFKLKLADDISASLGHTTSETERIPLPPSFKTERIMPFRYMYVMSFSSSLNNY